MAKVYLHDIPLNTFTKYYLGSGVDNISNNARYQPASTDYKVTTYYQYEYIIDDHKYSMNMVEIPKLKYEDETLTYLFNPKLFGTHHKFLYTLKYSIPKINTTLLPYIQSIHSDDDLQKFLDVHYNPTTNKFVINNIALNSIYKNNATSDEKGIKTASTQLQVYYIPFKDVVSVALKNLSLYKYYAKINNKIFPAIEFVNNNFYYNYNQKEVDLDILTNTTNNVYSGQYNVGRKKITEFFQKNSEDYISIDTSIINYDDTNKCKYYSIVLKDKPEVEFGKIYILPKYQTLDYNNDGKAHYIDTYTGQDKYFTPDTMPVSPLMKYHNYMRQYKESIINSDQEVNDATKYPTTNDLYYISYSNVDEIGFGFKYIKSTTTPAAMATSTPSTAISAYISSLIPKTVTTYSTTTFNEKNTFISWNSLDFEYKLDSNIYGNSTAVIDCSRKTPIMTCVQETTKLLPDETQMYNQYIIDKNYTYAFSDNKYSRTKTIFSTEKMICLYKYRLYGKQDTISQPYLSYGIALSSIPEFVASNSAKIELHITNKTAFEKFQEYKKLTDFLVVDTLSEIENGAAKVADILKIKQNCPIYYFTVEASGVTQDNSADGVGNETIYKVYLQPLSRYIASFITSQNSSSTLNDASLKYKSISKNTQYEYSISTNINTTKISSALSSFHAPNVSTLESRDKYISSLTNLKRLFNSINKFKDSSTIAANPISYGDSTRYNQASKAFTEIYPAVVTSQRSNVYITNAAMNKYNLNEYVDSLFKNLLYVAQNTCMANNGSQCFDKYSNKSYFGFINYDSTLVYYNYSKEKVNQITQEAYSEATEYPLLSTVELEAIQTEVENKNPLERLLNYKKYVINAEEVNALSNNYLYKKYNDSIVSTENITFNKLTSITSKEYESNCFDIQDIVDKSFVLFTDYLFTDNRTYSDIDRYDSETDQSQQSFYRRDIQNYLVKLLDESNQFIYTNNNSYGLKYVFQNDETDKETFLTLLSKLSSINNDSSLVK